MSIFFRGCNLNDAFLSEEDLMSRFAGQELWAWGYGTAGRLGDNTAVSKSSPVQTFAAGTNWASIGTGAAMGLAIKTDGSLWTWGCGTLGRLGNNTTTVNRSSPVQTFAAGTNWKKANAYSQVLATKTDGSLWTWGNNSNGQLGDGTLVTKSSPVQTSASGTNWNDVAAGNLFSVATKTDGSLWVWGSATEGRIASNNTINFSTPTQTVSGGTNWKKIAAFCNGIGIKTDGTLWMWGSNYLGRIGNNSSVRDCFSSPIQTVSNDTNWKSASNGIFHTLAVKTNGTLWAWGRGLPGVMGNNQTINMSSPVQTISGGSNWRVASSSGNSVAIKTDGTLWVWGYGGISLGANSTPRVSSPVQTAAGGTNWRSVCNGSPYLALRLTGE